MKVLPKNKWKKVLSFNCGCEAEDTMQDQVWSIVNFCPEHDPTIEKE